MSRAMGRIRFGRPAQNYSLAELNKYEEAKEERESGLKRKEGEKWDWITTTVIPPQPTPL